MTIFLSYAHEDLPSIEPLSRDLEELAGPVWYDRSLAGGQEWWNQILGQIRESRLFVLAISRHSLGSEACLAEWTYASAVARPLLTVRVDGVDLIGAPPSIKRHQYVDFAANDADTIRKLAKAVRFVPAETPLPAVLPPEPAVPESYKDRFAHLYARELAVAAQVESFALLKLDIDNDSNAAEALKLLGVLRDRFDTSWRVREDIDSYLANRATAKPTATEPVRLEPQPIRAVSTPQQPLPVSGWYPDPTRRYEIRYWDGAAWTEHVGRGGTVSKDPFAN